MARKGINKQQVFKTAKEIVAAGVLPTATKIRARLKTGSMVTIQRHLQEWKKSCFECAHLNEKIINLNNQQDNNELLEELRILEQSLNKQIIKNENYAQELINAEKINVALKEENRQLQIDNQELQLRLTVVEAANNALGQMTQEINNKLDANDNRTIQKMQQTIDDLRVELKTLNETSLTALRDTSTKGHEALMQEKVTSINLQAKIDSLTKELLESKKQWELANIKAHVHIQSLQRQIDQQQKILKNYLSSAQLQELDQGIEVNYILEAGYGK